VMINQWYEIMENSITVGFLEAQCADDALLKWASTHGPGQYRALGMWMNGQPVIKKTNEYLENSLGERAYKCIYCGNWVREGYSQANHDYVCAYCS